MEQIICINTENGNGYGSKRTEGSGGERKKEREKRELDVG